MRTETTNRREGISKAPILRRVRRGWLLAALVPTLAAVPATAAPIIGDDEPPRENPWMCRIAVEFGDAEHVVINGTPYAMQRMEFCSGTVVSPGDAVLTAAHCFARTPGKVHVQCGDYSEELEANSASFFSAPRGNQSITKNAAGELSSPGGDVAVLKLSNIPDGIRNSPYPRLARSPEEIAALTGPNSDCRAWGFGPSADGRVSGILRSQRMRNMSPDLEPYGLRWQGNHMIQWPGIVQHGDSGGPVVCRSRGDATQAVIVAINSYIIPLKIGDEPIEIAAYETLSASLAWIKSQTGRAEALRQNGL